MLIWVCEFKFVADCLRQQKHLFPTIRIGYLLFKNPYLFLAWHCTRSNYPHSLALALAHLLQRLRWTLLRNSTLTPVSIACSSCRHKPLGFLCCTSLLRARNLVLTRFLSSVWGISRFLRVGNVRILSLADRSWVFPGNLATLKQAAIAALSSFVAQPRLSAHRFVSFTLLLLRQNLLFCLGVR